VSILKHFRKRRPVVTVRQLSHGEIAELIILRWHGLTPDEWDALPALVKVDRREEFYTARGLAS